eukprot:scaffold3600_cov387-Prasinococcus_capsulatus_cf.AAC.3
MVSSERQLQTSNAPFELRDPRNLSSLVMLDEFNKDQADPNVAEMCAIFWVLLNHPINHRLTIFTDSKATLKRLQQHIRDSERLSDFAGPEDGGKAERPKSRFKQELLARAAQEAQCRSSLLFRSIIQLLALRTAKTYLRHIPAHKGRDANERADNLARLAVELVQEDRAVYCPIGDARSHKLWEMIKQWARFLGSWSLATEKEVSDAKRGRGKAGRPVPVNDDFSETAVVALDCEMVGIGPGGYTSRLAHVVVVNEYGNVLLETHAKPSEVITDYRTQWSGVREKDLVNAPPVMEVQERVRKLVDGKILVGHSLECDLDVLDIQHPADMTRDTAYFPPFTHMSGRPQKLKHLCRRHLGLTIQVGEHSPAEDARATLYLYNKYKTKWERLFNKKKRRQPTEVPAA